MILLLNSGSRVSISPVCKRELNGLYFITSPYFLDFNSTFAYIRVFILNEEYSNMRDF